MRITLNLATRPFSDHGPAIKNLRISMGVMALVAIVLGLGIRALHQKAEEARAREHALDARIAFITHERQTYQDLMRLPANAGTLAQSVALNQLFDEKSFSWTLAMEDLETVLPGGVNVSTLEPIRAKDGQITLHLRVIGPRDRAVELVENLEHSKRFLLPRIVGENSESTGGPGEQLQPVSASNRFNFDLLADYNPVTSADIKPAHRAEKAPADQAEKTKNQPIAPHTAKSAPGPMNSAQFSPAQRPTHPPFTGVSRPPAPPVPNQKAKPNAGGPR